MIQGRPRDSTSGNPSPRPLDLEANPRDLGGLVPSSTGHYLHVGKLEKLTQVTDCKRLSYARHTVGFVPSPVKETASAAATWTALIIVYIVWGSTYLAIRVTVETIPPFAGAAARFVAAAAILGAFVGVRRGWGALRVTRRELLSCAIVGTLLLAGGNGLVMYSERTVSSGIAALLIAIVPLLVVMFRLFSGDKPRAVTTIGVLVGLCGLAVLVLPGASGGVPPLASGLIIVGAGCWAFGSFLSPRLSMPGDPLVATIYEMALGGAVLIVISLLAREPGHLRMGEISARSWWALGYLVAIGSLVGFTAYVWLLHHAPLSLVATYAYVNPVVAVALGAVLLSEPITGAVLLGGAIIVAGVVLVVANERPTRTTNVEKCAVAAAPAALPLDDELVRDA